MRAARGLAAATRGGGPAPLRWGEEGEERRERFELRPLSASRRADLEHTAALGEDRSAPETAPEVEASERVDVGASGGERAWRRPLSPRHRRAVREYFGAGGPGGGEKER